MVLMAATTAAAADDDGRRHASKEKSSPPASAPAGPQAGGSSTRTPLHGFSFPTSFGWGTRRLLRCAKEGGEETSPIPSPEKEKGKEVAGDGGSQPSRPWNLRARRPSNVAPNAAPRSEAAAGKKAPAAVQAVVNPPPPSPVAAPSPKKRGFTIALTKQEIAADFLAIRGTAPPRRSRKRPRALQRLLDPLFPGLPLADVDLDNYKIEER
uniref:Uncharacterized protein n=1 Tax=Leersia perrieri TaxID=77586 RepID=A0A0D9WJF4_9ORYZ